MSTGSASFIVASWLTARTPRGVLYWASRVGGGLYYWLSGSKRRNYLANTSASVPFGAGVRPWHAFQNHALNVLELLGAVSGRDNNLPERIGLQGREFIDAALVRGRGMILTTFHVGNWELSGLRLASAGYPITTVAGEQLRRGWSDHVKAFKARYGIRVLPPGSGLRGLYRDLDENRVAVLHIDGNIFSGGFEVSFMGRNVCVPRGPAHLSRVFGAPLSVAYCRRRHRDRLEVVIEPPHEPPKTAEEEHSLTRRVVSRVEQCILDDPGQWCIFRKL